MSVVVHGHAHRGAAEGKTSAGIPVYNVAVPVLRVRLGPLVERKLDGVTAEDESSGANSVRERHQWKAGQTIGNARAKIVRARRTQPIVTDPGVDPMKVGKGAADRRRDADFRAIRAQPDDEFEGIQAGDEVSGRATRRHRRGAVAPNFT